MNRADNRLYPNELASDSFEVETSTVDCMLAECGIQMADLIKIDVQGFEGQVLRGMRETIRRSTELTILIEFWPHGLKSAGTIPIEVLGEWEDLGLRLFEMTRTGALAPLTDKQAFVNKLAGKRYTNIVGFRGAVNPELLDASD